MAMKPFTPRRLITTVLLGVIAVAALGYGIILVYANFINDPEAALTTTDLEQVVAAPSTVSSAPETAAPQVFDGLEGPWQATEESELGYRVDEVLFGVVTQGVGRTNQITGSLVIEGAVIISAQFEVDVASIRSDDSRRDGQFRGRIMSTSQFPTARFELTSPIDLGTLPAAGEQITATATGLLTLRGETREVTFEITAQHSDTRIGVLGEIEILFADYLIANPSISGIAVEDQGLLEFVLVFER
jgi:polyisoprenoid-binding protein YceI